MPRSATDKPNIRGLWMRIDYELTVGAVLVLAHTRLDQRSADATDHIVDVALKAGAYEASHSRLWRFANSKLTTR